MSEIEEGYASSIDLIYTDVYRSIASLSSRIDSLNTRLTLVLGFEAAFAKLAYDLPDQLDLVLNTESMQSVGCRSCLAFKLLTFTFLLVGIYSSLSGILPVPGKLFLDPLDQIEESQLTDRASFQEKVARLMSGNAIPDLEKALTKKSKCLQNGLVALGFASTLAIFDLVISTIFVAH